MKLAEQVSNYATMDTSLREIARKRAEEIIQEKFRPGEISVVIAAAIHRVVTDNTGNADPYRAMKDIEIAESSVLFDVVKDGYKDNFPDYLKLAALGNAVDFFRPIEDVKREIMRNSLAFTIDDSALLEGKVKRAKNILYLADNAGEVFFDLPLLMLMRRFSHVVYVVKESPTQNDITYEEVMRAGMQEKIGEVMTTGTATAGIDFSVASAEFKMTFEEADFIFAKGMGYYETLEELPANGRIFFCLKAKCTPVANSLNVPLGSYVALMH